MLFNAFSILFFYIQPFGTGKHMYMKAEAIMIMDASAVKVAIHIAAILRPPSKKKKAAQSVCKRGCSQHYART